MIRIKPEQDVTKRKAGVFRVNNLFHSSVFHIILSVCVCVCVCVCVWGGGGHVYVVYEDTNLYNDMGIVRALPWQPCLCCLCLMFLCLSCA